MSLTARLAVALHCFQVYCIAVQLNHRQIDEFVNYLWELPGLIHGYTKSDTSEDWQRKHELLGNWQSRKLDLFEVGVGDNFPEGFETFLRSHNVIPEKFRLLLECTVEIIYDGIFAGVASDSATLSFLMKVIAITAEQRTGAPPAQVFANSRFADNHGWGHPLSVEERERWRYLDCH